MQGIRQQAQIDVIFKEIGAQNVELTLKKLINELNILRAEVIKYSTVLQSNTTFGDRFNKIFVDMLRNLEQLPSSVTSLDKLGVPFDTLIKKTFELKTQFSAVKKEIDSVFKVDSSQLKIFDALQLKLKKLKDSLNSIDFVDLNKYKSLQNYNSALDKTINKIIKLEGEYKKYISLLETAIKEGNVDKAFDSYNNLNNIKEKLNLLQKNVDVYNNIIVKLKVMKNQEDRYLKESQRISNELFKLKLNNYKNLTKEQERALKQQLQQEQKAANDIYRLKLKWYKEEQKELNNLLVIQDKNINNIKKYIDQLDKLKFSIEKNIETKKRWTSRDNVNNALKYVEVLNNEEYKLNELLSKYTLLSKQRSEAIKNKDIQRIKELTSSLNKLEKEITIYSDKIRNFKKDTRGIVESLSSLDRLKWIGEVGTRALTYAGIYAGIYSGFQAIREGIEYIAEYDLALKTLQAVLHTTSAEAKVLEENFMNLAQTFGGTLEDVNKVAYALGRAGVETKDLVDATKVVISMALLTGDTYDTATNAIVTFNQNYKDYIENTYKGANAIEVLGNKLAYMANASRLSTQDIGTFANYALATAKNVGLTVDMVGALAIAFSNAGNNASTIGTMIRRFANILASSQNDVTRFFDSIGVNQQNLLESLQKGGKEANKAFIKFMNILENIDQETLQKITADMDILAKNTLVQMANQAGVVKAQFAEMLGIVTGELDNAKIIAESYINIWQRFKNVLGEIVTVLGNDIIKGATALLKSVMEIFNSEKTNAAIDIANQIQYLKEQQKLYEKLGNKEKVEEIGRVIKGLENRLKSLNKEISSTNKIEGYFKELSKLEKYAKVLEGIQGRMSKDSSLSRLVSQFKEAFKDDDVNKIIKLINTYKDYSDSRGEFVRDLLRMLSTDNKLTKQLENQIPIIQKYKNEIKKAQQELKQEQEKHKDKPFLGITPQEVKTLSSMVSATQKLKGITSEYGSEVKKVTSYIDDAIQRQLKFVKLTILGRNEDLSSELKSKYTNLIENTNSPYLLQQKLLERKNQLLKESTDEAKKELNVINRMLAAVDVAVKLEGQKNQLIKSNTVSRKQEIDYLEKYNSIVSNLLTSIQQAENQYDVAMSKRASETEKYEKVIVKANNKILEIWKSEKLTLEQKYQLIQQIGNELGEYGDKFQEYQKYLNEQFDDELLSDYISNLKDISKLLSNDMKKNVQVIIRELERSQFEKKLKKLKEELILKGIDEKKIKQKLNMMRAQFELTHNEAFIILQEQWDNTTKYLYDSIERNFFDLLTGKFKSLSDFLRALGRDILSNIINPIAKQLSGSLTESLFGSLGIPTQQSINTQKAITSSLISAGWKMVESGIFINPNTQEKVVVSNNGVKAFNSNGQEVSISDITSIPSTISNLVSFAINPSAVMMQPFTTIAKPLASVGYTGAAVNTLNFGYGFTNPMSVPQWTGTAGMAGGMAGAGLLGYGFGSLLNGLTGVESYAPYTGAIGGALASYLVTAGLVSNPVGWALLGLSVLGGGLFGGKWKLDDVGFGLIGNVSAYDLSNLKNWEFWRKEKIFGGDKKSNKYKDINSFTRAQIQDLLLNFENIVDTLNGTYEQINIILAKGRYSTSEKTKTFDEYVTKKLLAEITGIDSVVEKVVNEFEKEGYRYEDGWDAEGLILIEKYYKYRINKINDMIEKGYISATDKEKIENLDKIYKAWEKYAESVDKSVIEVIQEAFSDVQNIFNSFDAFNLVKKGLNGSDIIDTNNLLSGLDKTFYKVKDLIKEAGYDIEDVSELTSENFKEIYKAVLKNNPTPDTIERFNALGEAILNVADKAKTTSDLLDSYFGNINVADRQLMYSNINEIISKYFGKNKQTSNPEDILKLFENTNNEKALAAFAPYANKIIQDAINVKTKGADVVLAVIQELKKGVKTFEDGLDLSVKEIEALENKNKIAQDKLQNLREKLNIADLNIDNFMDYYNAAIEANPSAENIAQWNAYKDIVIEAADANYQYANAVQSVKESIINATREYWALVEQGQQTFDAWYYKYLDQENKNKIDALKAQNEAEQSNLQITINTLQNKIETIQTTLDNTIEDLNNQINSLNDTLQNTKESLNYLNTADSALQNIIDSLTGELDTNGTIFKNMYESAYNDAINAFNSGDYEAYTNAVKDIQTYSSYINNMQFSSAYEKKFEQAKLINELKVLKSPTEQMIDHLSAIEVNTQAMIDNLKNQIDDEKSLADSQIKALNNQIDELQKQKDALASINYDTTNILDEILNYKTEILGDTKFEEIIKNGVIQAFKSGDFTINLGEKYDDVLNKIKGFTDNYKEIPLSNGDKAILVDIDNNGQNDFAAIFGPSGDVKKIATNIADIPSTINRAFGDKNLTEVLKDGVIQAVFNDDFQISLGDTIKLIKTSLDSIDASWKELGKYILIDYNGDGYIDTVLKIDKTGFLQKIVDNTADIHKIIKNQLINAVKGVAEAGSTSITTDIAQNYTISDDFITTKEGNLIAQYYTPLLNDVKTYITLPDDDSYIKEHKQEILNLAKKISDNAQYLIAIDPEGGEDFSQYASGLTGKYETISGTTQLYDDLKTFFEQQGFASGGYTGNFSENSIVGVVHGNEFVFNASTTKKLGLNKDNGHIFDIMVEKLGEISFNLKYMVEELYIIKQENIKMRRSLSILEEK